MTRPAWTLGSVCNWLAWSGALAAGALLPLVLPLTLAARPLGSAPAQSLVAAAPQRRALLVGVTEFQDPRLNSRALKGPANDVDLFRQVLMQEPFSVPAGNIRVLKRGSDPAARPTQANIHREFVRLAQVARNGDHIVILLAGHGSQQPADPDPSDHEPDGLDEIFLPEDIGLWDGKIGRVKNALVDDDIRAWVAEIRKTGAFVWLIFDACHSGTMTRGAEVSRQIPMSELVPAEAIAVATDAVRGMNADSDLLGLTDSAGDVAALYAAHMAETTPEKPLPNSNSPVHGLFTYTLAEILSQSSSVLTYRELALRVLERYRSVPRVLAHTAVRRRRSRSRDPRTTILAGPTADAAWRSTRAGSWSMAAGSIQGLTVGSVLEVFPPAGALDAHIRIGHVRVTSVSPGSARVTPTAYDKDPAPAAARLVAGSRARIRYYEFGDLRLKIAYRGGKPIPVISRALSNLAAATNGLAEYVTTGVADWSLEVVGRRVVLVPAAGSQSAHELVLGGVDDPKISELIVTACKRIGRVRNLVQLASASGSGMRLELRVLRYPTATSTVGRALLSTPADYVIQAGQFAEFRVRNTGDRPVDVTVLYVDAAFGIEPLYPLRDREIDNQLRAGEERIVGRFAVSDMPLGWESAVAIGVESGAVRQNFSMLAQESIELQRGTDGSARSPLRRLLEQALLGLDERTRGATDVDPTTFAVKVVAWRTDAAK